MTNRGIAKWAPFNSVINGNDMVKDIIKKKNIKTMPSLSEDQINNLENKILNSYNNQSSIKIKYFSHGNYYYKEGIVYHIDLNNKKIALSTGYCIYFSQIIEIK